MSAAVLYIGNKNYSSWSVRPWLALRWAGIAFDEVLTPLGAVRYGKSKNPDILAASPSGRVPALHADGIVIHDSLAICEWAHERAPAAGLWPSDSNQRALARSVSAEMHSSFAALRRDLPMNIRRRMTTPPPALNADVEGDLERLYEMWSELLARSGGPFLFGARCIADAMYAPVLTRLRTYAIKTPPVVASYAEALFADSEFQALERDAAAETWRLQDVEELFQ
jgi:glutathione S-transferase